VVVGGEVMVWYEVDKGIGVIEILQYLSEVTPCWGQTLGSRLFHVLTTLLI
jgi:hypothetical protein